MHLGVWEVRWEIKDQRVFKTMLFRVSCNLGLKLMTESVFRVGWSVLTVGSMSPRINGNRASGEVSEDVFRTGKILAHYG